MEAGYEVNFALKTRGIYNGPPQRRQGRTKLLRDCFEAGLGVGAQSS